MTKPGGRDWNGIGSIQKPRGLEWRELQKRVQIQATESTLFSHPDARKAPSTPHKPHKVQSIIKGDRQ
jgi:hypothetical protein